MNTAQLMQLACWSLMKVAYRNVCITVNFLASVNEVKSCPIYLANQDYLNNVCILFLKYFNAYALSFQCNTVSVGGAKTVRSVLYMSTVTLNCPSLLVCGGHSGALSGV